MPYALLQSTIDCDINFTAKRIFEFDHQPRLIEQGPARFQINEKIENTLWASFTSRN